MARQETSYIVIHCSQTRPSQNIGAKEIDRWHRERGWLKIGYGTVIKRDGTIERGREDDEVQAAVKGYNHTSFNLCLVGGAKNIYLAGFDGYKNNISLNEEMNSYLIDIRKHLPQLKFFSLTPTNY